MKGAYPMGYQDEWLLLEAEDEIDEIEHQPPTEEFLFYQAVTNGDIAAVKENCAQERFLDSKGVGILSRDHITNLKYHFVITTAMVTRLCKQKGMELEQAFRMSDFYIQKLDDIHTVQGLRALHDAMVLDYTEKMHKICHSDTHSRHISACKEYIYAHIKERITIEDLADAYADVFRGNLSLSPDTPSLLGQPEIWPTLPGQGGAPRSLPRSLPSW